MVDSFAFGNGGAGFNLDTSGGALISGNHLYGQDAGSFDIDINIGSKALRVVHPDKVAADAPVRTRVTSKLVFSALNEAFARFKAAG